MDPKKYFKKYHTKLKLEAILKSLLLGLIIGSSAAFVMAATAWFVGFNGLWIAIGILVAVTAASTTLFYLKKFKLTAEGNARRLDRYGLEERLITMVEYDGDDSYIAKAQREDAKAELEKFEANRIKFKFAITKSAYLKNPSNAKLITIEESTTNFAFPISFFCFNR